MLSGAKHLQYPLENKQMQILRPVQDDSPRGFFRNLLARGVRECPQKGIVSRGLGGCAKLLLLSQHLRRP